MNSLFFQHMLSKQFHLTVSSIPAEGMELKGIRYFTPELDADNCLILMPQEIGSWSYSFANIQAHGNVYLFYDTIPASFPALPAIKVSKGENAETIYMLWNRIAAIWEKLEQWEQELDAISATDHDYQHLFDRYDDMLLEPISLIDSHFNYIAYSQKLSRQRGYEETFVDDVRTLPMDIATRLIIDPQYQALEKRTGLFEFTDDFHFMACNIFYENIYVGRLISICTENEAVDAYQRVVLCHLANYVTAMYRNNTTFYLEQPAFPKLHSLFLQALESGSVSSQEWVPLLAQLSWNHQDTYVLVQLNPTFRYEKNLYPEYICPQIERRWPFILAVVYKEALFVLMNLRLAPEKARQEFTCFLRDNLMSSGNSRSFHHISGLPEAARQTAIALKYGREKNPHFWYHDFDDYAFDYVMDRVKGELSGRNVCHPALLLLMEEDNRRHTQYYKTLYTYFKNRYNTVAAARELFIHRTTFIKRMEHIEKLMKVDLTDWQTCQYLMLSFLLLGDEC